MVGLFGGLLVGLFGGLLVGVFFGLSSIEIKEKMIPNQGIQLSLKNALLAGLFFGLLFFAALGLFTGLMVGNLSVGLFWGLFWGLLVGFSRYGGITVIQHYVLRFILSVKDYLPWDLISFLNWATERIFLRRVGGGYIFIHRMVMEHFATLDKKDIEELAS